MTDVITSDNIASVSLADADRDPGDFAERLGRSFVEYGFAIVRDHGIPADLIARAEEKAKEFFALPRAAAGPVAIRRSGSKPPRASPRMTSRSSGTSAASFPKDMNIAR